MILNSFQFWLARTHTAGNVLTCSMNQIYKLLYSASMFPVPCVLAKQLKPWKAWDVED